MTWPFLAIILHHRYNLSPSYIGGLLSISVFLSTLIGIYFGYISDKIGRVKVLALGCTISIIAFTLLAVMDKLNIYIFAIMLVGLANPMFIAFVVEQIKNRSSSTTITPIIISILPKLHKLKAVVPESLTRSTAC